MAKISLNLDTESKEFAVSIDGEALANVMNVYCYPTYDSEDEYEYRVEICTMEKMDNGVNKRTYFSAAEEEEVKGEPHPKCDKVIIKKLGEKKFDLASVIKDLIRKG